MSLVNPVEKLNPSASAAAPHIASPIAKVAAISLGFLNNILFWALTSVVDRGRHCGTSGTAGAGATFTSQIQTLSIRFCFALLSPLSGSLRQQTCGTAVPGTACQFRQDELRVLATGDGRPPRAGGPSRRAGGVARAPRRRRGSGRDGARGRGRCEHRGDPTHTGTATSPIPTQDTTTPLSSTCASTTTNTAPNPPITAWVH